MTETKNAVVSRQDPEARAKREAKRGVVRDSQGRIIRSAKWLKARVSKLEMKKETLSNRLANVANELKTRKQELKSVKD